MNRRGVTLIEMMVVVTILALLAAVSFPSVTTGVDSIRLASASDQVVSFLNSGLNRAERRQTALEVTILRQENALVLASVEPGYSKRLEMPEGIRILTVLPEDPVQDPDAPRRFLLLAGAAVPRFGVVLGNSRGQRRTVRVDPITGAPQIERWMEK